MKAIQIDKRSASVATPIDIVHKPAISQRGMHFNGWAFKNPYSFRDWRRPSGSSILISWPTKA